MGVRRLNAGVRRLGLLLAVAVVILLSSSTTCFAVAHNMPGTPMGPAGASGTVDSMTSPWDVYSVYLFSGRTVYFSGTRVDYHYVNVVLFVPDTGSVSDGSKEIVYDDIRDGISYTPAVSGVYHLGVHAQSTGAPYTVVVAGAETMPQITHTALHVSSTVKVNRKLSLSGTVSPSMTTAGSVTVTKKRYSGGKWRSAGSATVQVVAGKYRYSFSPSKKGRWRFVAQFHAHTIGTTTYAGSKSIVKSVKVH